MLINSFLLPLIFAGGGFFSVTVYSRFKKVISFKETFRRAFMPMFLGGFFSFLFIGSYINFVSTETKDLLNYQYVESFKNSLENEYTKAKQSLRPGAPQLKEVEEKYAEGKLRIQEKLKRKEDMFTMKNFFYVFSGYCLYFLLLSLFFGGFFRTKKSELTA